MKKVSINNPEVDWLIGTEGKVTLEEEIELLDGASAEFDQELVDKGELFSGIFRIRADEFWCGDIPAAFPRHDHVAAAKDV